MMRPGSGGRAIMRAERGRGWHRWFHMESPARYFEFAEECERLAKQAANERHRAILLEMAKAWRKLAGGTNAKR
jgi:hypothetical protein